MSCGYPPNGLIPFDAQFTHAVKSKRIVGCSSKFKDLEVIGFKAASVANVKLYGAVGNGSTDDTAAIEAALAENTVVYFPEGTYRTNTGISVPSERTLIGQGGVIYNPNAVEQATGLYFEPNSTDISIYSLIIKGPYCDTPAARGLSILDNIGIYGRGRWYQRNVLGLNMATVSGYGQNIIIEDCEICGWGEDSILIDNYNNVEIENCYQHHNCRGGTRFYGVEYFRWTNNRVDDLFKGDSNNLNANGLSGRTYGFTASRVYGNDATLPNPSVVFRPSKYGVVSNNEVTNSTIWKGIDTHGGQNIIFSNNFVASCHHAFGIDKAGSTATQGINPPRNIVISGNVIHRISPPNPLEGADTVGGDYGTVGNAIFITAHDQTDAQMGFNCTIVGNTIEGWGSDVGPGAAIAVYNWNNITISNNSINDSFGIALRLRERIVALSVSGNSFGNVKLADNGTQTAINVESGNVVGVIGSNSFRNDTATTLTAVFLANPNATYGVTMSKDQSYYSSAAAAIRNNFPNNNRDGTALLSPKAWGNINGADGSILGGSLNFTLNTRSGVGVYVYDLPESVYNSLNVSLVVTIEGVTAGFGTGQMTGGDQFTIRTFNATGAAADLDFNFIFCSQNSFVDVS